MIVVDTSVWVAALRSSKSSEAVTLAGLLDADEVVLPTLVRTELLCGCSPVDLPKLRRTLSALSIVVPGDDTWKTADRWVEQAVARGHRFGVADLVIGVLAWEIGALVWSLDAAFARLARMKFVELYDPPRGASL